MILPIFWQPVSTPKSYRTPERTCRILFCTYIISVRKMVVSGKKHREMYSNRDCFFPSGSNVLFSYTGKLEREGLDSFTEAALSG